MNDIENGLALWLDRLTLRSTLTEHDRQAVLSLPGEVATIRANRDFVRLGEHVDKACLIVSGFAGRFGQTRSGERQTTALHMPGDMADLHSVVLPKAATALQSIGETVIYRVPHKTIHALAASSAALAEAFWRDCMVDAAVLSQWALVNARLAAKARIAHLICELSRRVAVGGCRDGMVIEWPLTQQQLGDATALTPVHTNRMLRQLREEGAAEVSDRKMYVRDWDLLRSIAEFDDQYLQLQQAD